jgi:hypothetical protein
MYNENGNVICIPRPKAGEGHIQAFRVEGNVARDFARTPPGEMTGRGPVDGAPTLEERTIDFRF